MNFYSQRKYKVEYAFELLKIAEGDLLSAQVLFNNFGQGRKENICYHAEQSVEKSIKAYLCFTQIPLPLTHDLGVLIDKIPENSDFPIDRDITSLTEYATIRRYEEGVIDLEAIDVETIIQIATKILQWVNTKIIIP